MITEKDIIHIINHKTGERKTLLLSQCQSNQESDNHDFEIDFEWYDNNGYMDIDDVRKLIEGKDYKNG